jgi:integrase
MYGVMKKRRASAKTLPIDFHVLCQNYYRNIDLEECQRHKLLRRTLKSFYRTEGEYPFRTVTGLPFSEETFRKNYWIPALEKTDVAYKEPYSTRHTFAAWSLTIGVDPNRLVRLMGHGSKKIRRKFLITLERTFWRKNDFRQETLKFSWRKFWRKTTHKNS